MSGITFDNDRVANIEFRPVSELTFQNNCH